MVGWNSLRTAINAVTPESTRLSVIRLYRYACRSIPYLQQSYKLPFSKTEMRDYIRHRFDEYKDLKDYNKVEMLVWKGEQDLEEALNVWKTRSHVIRTISPVINPQKVSKRNDFLKNFYEKFERD